MNSGPIWIPENVPLDPFWAGTAFGLILAAFLLLVAGLREP